MTKRVFIEQSDFSEVHDKKNFGLSPEQHVYLKYGPVLKFHSIERNADGSIALVKVEALPDFGEKLKGHIHWVSKDHAITSKVNLYSVLFLEENVAKLGDDWIKGINPDSLIVKD